MQLLILLFCLMSMILITCFFSKGDLLMPSVVLNSAYILSLLVLVFSPFDFTLHWNTVGIMLLGLVSFQAVELLFFSRKELTNIKKTRNECISFFNISFVIVIQIITLFLLIQDIKRIGQSSLWNSVKSMRSLHMYSASLGSSEYVSFYVSRLMKVNFAAGYVNLFFLIRDITCRERNKYTALYFVSVCMYFFQAILSGGRSQALRLFFAAFIDVLITYRMKYGWKTKLRFTTLVKVMIGIFVAGAAFYGSRLFFGRSNQANLSFASIFASYYSGGVFLFDAYMQHPFKNTGSLVGTQTFKDFFNLLYKYGFRQARVIPQLEFRNMGNTINNTYTAFRYYYQDFGIKGVVLLQMLLSFIYNMLYLRIKKHGSECFVVVYSFVFFALVMHCIVDQFFSIISFGYVETIGWIIMLWIFETRVVIHVKSAFRNNMI